MQVIAFSSEDLVRFDGYRHEEVTGWSAVRAGFALTSKANLLAVNDAGRDAHGDIAGAMNRAGTVAVLARVRDAAAGAIAILAGGGKAEGAAVFRGKTGATAGATGRGLAGCRTRAVARGTRSISAQR